MTLVLSEIVPAVNVLYISATVTPELCAAAVVPLTALVTPVRVLVDIPV